MVVDQVAAVRRLLEDWPAMIFKVDFQLLGMNDTARI